MKSGGNIRQGKKKKIGYSPRIHEIKKAYRKMSLVYHPDKNQDDPLASVKFIGISKAFKALTITGRDIITCRFCQETSWLAGVGFIACLVWVL